MANTQKLLRELRRLIETFEEHHDDEDLRLRVQHLLPVSTTLLNLGKSLISDNLRESAQSRLLKYFQMYPRVPLPDRELALVAGISEWARRIRELRTEQGWPITTEVKG